MKMRCTVELLHRALVLQQPEGGRRQGTLSAETVPTIKYFSRFGTAHAQHRRQHDARAKAIAVQALAAASDEVVAFPQERQGMVEAPQAGNRIIPGHPC